MQAMCTRLTLVVSISLALLGSACSRGKEPVDTGVAHLGRAVWTPTVAIFGPGSPVVCARGRFWRDTPWEAVAEDPFPCRDQRILFRREVDWMRRCARSTAECPEPRCMQAVGLEAVLAACRRVRATGHPEPPPGR